MKKNLSGKHKNHKGKKLSRINRSKLQRSKKNEIVFRNPGPSPLITKGEDGKVVITNIVGSIKQKDYTTKVGKDSRQENKTIKQAKKELIKRILASAGFEPTIHYTKKEKKKFTRVVKNNLFIKPKPVTLTDEQTKERVLEKKNKRAELLKNRPHRTEVETAAKEATINLKNMLKEFQKKRSVQVTPTPQELSAKEIPEKRKFTYTEQRRSEDNPLKDYDFTTDYFEAESREDALKKAKKLFSKHIADESFTGVRLKDSKSNLITYYPKAKLAA